MGRQNGEGNEMRKRERQRQRERGNCQKEKQTTRKEGRNAMQES
jgi:hypothetical protein